MRVCVCAFFFVFYVLLLLLFMLWGRGEGGGVEGEVFFVFLRPAVPFAVFVDKMIFVIIVIPFAGFE